MSGNCQGNVREFWTNSDVATLLSILLFLHCRYQKLMPELGFMFVHHTLVDGVFDNIEPEEHHLFHR